MKNATTHSVQGFDVGLYQHRVTMGSLVAAGLAPAGKAPASWMVSRVSSRGVRWTLSATSGTLRAMHRPECRRMASVLRAVERGRF